MHGRHRSRHLPTPHGTLPLREWAMPTHRRQAAALAARTSELWFAAPQVVAMRLARMAQHGMQPDARDQAEMLRMGSEKIAAFSQGWVAMWMAFWTFPLRMTPARAMTVAAAGLAPVHRTAVANAKRLSGQRPRRSRKASR
jgi:hypothetical protein